MKKQSSFYPSTNEVSREWISVNAEGAVLGRLATAVASILRGKHKPEFTDSVDVGDFVIVYNAEKITVTGRKGSQKKYYRHSGYPGGLKTTTFDQLLERNPEQIIHNAVKGMLPHNRIGRQMITKLKVYVGTEHPHEAQQPKEISL
ncbi:50S ribosomal protein L13 [Candidatus Marinamargulisbacteria bacterium SCGC AAA071-K20]|nr:50S ribosomal protein L13 [Candidatus Marinamargulisbacteria bacterium SCGC AAA071-K20]